jgi:hypothetical protein
VNRRTGRRGRERGGVGCKQWYCWGSEEASGEASASAGSERRVGAVAAAAPGRSASRSGKREACTTRRGDAGGCTEDGAASVGCQGATQNGDGSDGAARRAVRCERDAQGSAQQGSGSEVALRCSVTRSSVTMLQVQWLFLSRRGGQECRWSRGDRSTGRGRELFFGPFSAISARLGLCLRR